MTISFRDWLGRNAHLGKPFAAFAAMPSWTTDEDLHAQLHQHGAEDRECVYLSIAKDAWLGTIKRWEYDCADCGTDSTDERYMVRDHVWAAAGMCPFGFLCVGCIEKRLGRRLNASDFLAVPLNHAPGYRRSERLAARLASRT